MNRINTLLLLLTLTGFLFLTTACGGTPVESANQTNGGEHMDDEHADDGHADEHMDDMPHMHVDAPDEFADLSNPLGADHEAIEAGEAIFQVNCATCHGPEGKGDGPGAEGLDPKPADLTDGTMMGDLSDGYLFWRVSKGGAIEPFTSAMPAWENVLTEEQRWQAISYIRSLTAAAAEEAHEHMEDEHMEGDEHSADEHMEDEQHMEGDEHTEEGEHGEDEN